MRLSIKLIIIIGVLSLVLVNINAYAKNKLKQPTQPIYPSLKARTFINYMVKEHHFNRKKLTLLFTKVKYNQDVIQKITYPYESKPWNIYRAHFITKARIEQGTSYWKKHLKALRYAQKHYGVPPSVIVAVIGIETNYGEHTGDYIAINALSTLAFKYRKRSKFFTKELAQFLLLTREQQLPALLVKSSYAGAIGIPQFMPSTYRHYAVGYAKKNHTNIMNNDPDAIVSIANYFYLHGWKKGHLVACKFSGKIPDKLRPTSERPHSMTTIRELKKIGIHPDTDAPLNNKATFIELENQHGREYWLVFDNFKAIMTYNRSIAYAMAVFQLSKAIKKSYDQQISTTRSTTIQARKI